MDTLSPKKRKTRKIPWPKECRKPPRVMRTPHHAYGLFGGDSTKTMATSAIRHLHGKGFLAQKRRICDGPKGWAVYKGPYAVDARKVARERRGGR